eukprot:COSAG02_NODE_26_length_51927_cov_61.213881_19_plen_212_part_00
MNCNIVLLCAPVNHPRGWVTWSEVLETQLFDTAKGTHIMLRGGLHVYVVGTQTDLRASNDRPAWPPVTTAEDAAASGEAIVRRMRAHPCVRTSRYFEVSPKADPNGVRVSLNRCVREAFATASAPCLWLELCAEQRLCLGLGVHIERIGGGSLLNQLPSDVTLVMLEHLQTTQQRTPWWRSEAHDRFIQHFRHRRRQARRVRCMACCARPS